MNISSTSKRLSWCMVAALALGLASQAGADPGLHVDPGRQDPWNNCTTSHGTELDGGIAGVSCYDCHQAFAPPDTPPVGHHNPPGEWQHVLTEPRRDPITNGCTVCHGGDLLGDIGPSCFSCHDQLWTTNGGEQNAAPNVDPGGPYVGVVGQPLEFDASATTDPDGDTLVYLWTFGDGSPPQFPSQVPTITHTYESEGTYTAVLTVTDGVNDPVMVQFTVEILATNLPPTADAGGPYSGIAGQAIQFDGSASSDPEGAALSYSWDFGDGTPPSAPSQQPTLSHVYQAAGTYTVVLTVSDGFNDPVTDQVEVEVIPPNLPPTADPGGPYSGTAGQPVQLDASGSSDPDGDPLTYQWDYGDGSPPSAPSPDPMVSHTYQDAGTYTAVLTVDDGVNDPVSAQVTVEIAEPEEPPPPPAGDTWNVTVPFAFTEFTITLDQFGPILLVEMTLPDGSTRFGIGFELGEMICWMDSSGALFLGSVDRDAGTMWGIVFAHHGRTSIWFAEPL